MKKLVFTLVFVLSITLVNAQYKHSLGAAFGSPSGISFKTFGSGNKALDFTLGGLGKYFILSGMYEIHCDMANNLKWYYGPGAHIGSWSGNKYGSGAFAGVDGVLGLELKPNIPFAFSVDLRPGINLIGNQWDDHFHYFFWQSQLAIRYTF
jgi:hypothetical protein